VRRTCYAWLVLLGAPGLVQAQGTIPAGRWRSRPAIRAVRAIVQQIDRQQERLIRSSDSATCGFPYISVTATLYSDSAGVVRKYHVASGHDDSAGEATYYYDSRGNVRFVFTTENAVNGTSQERRAYYDSTGVLLHRASRRLAGPGYPNGWPDEPIPDPRSDFGHLCGGAK
jgi:hypothetical protein